MARALQIDGCPLGNIAQYYLISTITYRVVHCFSPHSLMMKLRLREQGASATLLRCWCLNLMPRVPDPDSACVAPCKCQVGKGAQPWLPAPFHHSSTELLPGGGGGSGHAECISNKCLVDEKGSSPACSSACTGWSCCCDHLLNAGERHVLRGNGKGPTGGQDRLPRGKSFAGASEGWKGGESRRSRGNSMYEGWETQEGEAGRNTCELFAPGASASRGLDCSRSRGAVKAGAWHGEASVPCKRVHRSMSRQWGAPAGHDTMCCGCEDAGGGQRTGEIAGNRK